MDKSRYHLEQLETLYKHLGTRPDGLTAQEAVQKLDQFGPNELKAKRKKTPFMMFLDQFKDFMILVLFAAAIVAGIAGEMTDTLIIIAIIIANAIIGFIQEYRAEKAIEALKQMAAPVVNVLRDGRAQSVPSREVVPGDIVLLEAGAIIPADMRLIENAQLKIDEAALTGESVPVEKSTGELSDPEFQLVTG